MKMGFYELEAKNIQGQNIPFASYRGKVVVVVNTASKCGYTPQYDGLEALQKKYHAQGFEVLGFPCNQFGGQEPGTEAEISQFCETRFNIEFPMFAKVDVNGANTHPVFAFLKSQAPGILGTEAIKWNFTKFLVSKDGKVLNRYAPSLEPIEMTADIEKALKS